MSFIVNDNNHNAIQVQGVVARLQSQKSDKCETNVVECLESYKKYGHKCISNFCLIDNCS